MTRPQPWTFVLSEYLDLAFLLRGTGESVVNARSCAEGLICLSHYRPGRVVLDLSCYGAQQVLEYIRENYPDLLVENQDQVIEQLLAS